MSNYNEHNTLAAVDLGSNSFKLQIARVIDDHLYPLDALKEPVRLTAGIGLDKRLDAASQTRALACLSRFNERLRGLPQGAVRCVGTSALRVAENATEFLALAESTLGYPIEIIAGREEARLVYLGVVRSLPAAKHPRLVIDIGGGSTECIIGVGLHPHITESLHLGCVNFTQRFFPDGYVSTHAMQQAEIAARAQAQTIAAACAGQWQEAIGSSGSARIISEVLVQNKLSEQDITLDGLLRLREMMIACGHQNDFNFLGMKPDRKPVFSGGVAVMLGVFIELGITHMKVADGALREGVLYDMLGRFHQQDMRAVTVEQFMRRYHVDTHQAMRVADTANKLLVRITQVPNWPEESLEESKHYLTWAAQLHEIGLSIAHSGYHKHGAYILANADMPGFSQKEQSLLSTLVVMQRGASEKLRGINFGSITHAMIMALRLSVLICRNRISVDFTPTAITFSKDSCTLSIPQAWLDNNPLTMAALRDETKAWKQAGYMFAVQPI